MRNKVGISLLLMITLTLHFLAPVEADTTLNDTNYDTPLVTRIVSIDLPAKSFDISLNQFQLDILVEVWNNQTSEISIDYPEACGFVTHIRSLTLNPESTLYSVVICGDLTIPMVFSPGLTELNTTLLFSTEGKSDSLPNGEYIITYGNLNSGLSSDLVSFVETTMNVMNGEIAIVNHPLPSGWGTTPSNLHQVPPEDELVIPYDDELVIPNLGDLDAFSEINSHVETQVAVVVVVDVMIDRSTEKSNIDISQIFIAVSFIIGTIRFVKSKL